MLILAEDLATGILRAIQGVTFQAIVGDVSFFIAFYGSIGVCYFVASMRVIAKLRRTSKLSSDSARLKRATVYISLMGIGMILKVIAPVILLSGVPLPPILYHFCYWTAAMVYVLIAIAMILIFQPQNKRYNQAFSKSTTSSTNSTRSKSSA